MTWKRRIAVVFTVSAMLLPVAAFADDIQPELSIPIPTVRFSDIIVSEVPLEGAADTGTQQTVVRTLDIPWIADYIAGVYRYAIYVATILAAVMLMIGGLQWLTAAGDAGRVSSAKTRINNAIVGLVLTLGTYVVLSAINPDLVSLSALQIRQVEKQMFENEEAIQSVYGTMAEDSAYEQMSGGESVDSGAAPTGTAGGDWRTRMMSSAVCGDKNGMSLPSYEARQQRLRQIVQAWKTIGIDEGGAIYVRGGSYQCSSSNPDPGYLVTTMRTAQQRISGFTVPEACQTSIDRYNAASSSEKSAIGRGELRTNCQPVYDQLVTDRARAAGLLCGDCFSTMIHLYSRCFDRNDSMRTQRMFPYRVAESGRLGNPVTRCPSRGSPDETRYVFRLTNPTEDAARAAVAQLRFGDLMTWQTPTAGHVFMYTGGANLGYEIMEMGSGGAGDVVGAGRERAQANAGTPYPVSGMRVHASAAEYLAQVARSKQVRGRTGGVCIFAWRPLAD